MIFLSSIGIDKTLERSIIKLQHMKSTYIDMIINWIRMGGSARTPLIILRALLMLVALLILGALSILFILAIAYA